MKIGIFFGGPVREREISFAGGKTAMENIDKTLFEPIPVFVDGLGNFIVLKPELVYSASIRDFYPPKSYQGDYSIYVESLGELSEEELNKIIAEVGERISPEQFSKKFDFVFIAMHGPACEDGSIQGLLEWYGVPYSGPSLMGSSIGIDKIAQNDLIRLAVGLDKKTTSISREYFESKDTTELFEEVKASVGLPFVVKAPHQGSSIGVAFVKKDVVDDFVKAVKQCLFIREVSLEEWNSVEHQEFVQRMANLDEGIGLPVSMNGEVVYHPAELLTKISAHFEQSQENVALISMNSEDAILIEGFVKGQEFSCGVIQNPDCESVALPPTEIVANVEVFDFKAKYQSSATRKKIPINTSLENNQQVQADVKKAFDSLKFGVCTRIDGFVTPEGKVLLHDPNTIPGMSPTSIIFKQMAEIGLNVTDSITYFIRQSIRERMRTGKSTFKFQQLLTKLDVAIAKRIEELDDRQKVAIIFGGFSAEAQEESFVKARKVYATLSASTEFYPVPVFVTGENHLNEELYLLPTNLMFKEFAEDIAKVLDGSIHPLIAETRIKAEKITLHYTGKKVGVVEQISREKLTEIADLTSICTIDFSIDLPVYL